MYNSLLVFVLGINTGTSVDGVDLALVKWNANDLKKFQIIEEASYEIDPTVKQEIEMLISKQVCSLEAVSNLHYKIGRFLGFIVNEFKKEFPQHQIDLIGMHGQTVFHGTESSMQLGNIGLVSKLAGITTVGDFRSGDIAFGGNGAPLTSFLDDILIRDEGDTKATLNIGGIANITIMNPGEPTLAYDTGPGNTLIDCLMKKLFQKDYDNNGDIARFGKVNENFIDALIRKTDYFHKAPPKTTGREFFDEKFADKFLDLGNKENIIANVSYFTAKTISNEIQKYKLKQIFVAGGGYRNKYLMETMQALNPGVELSSHDGFHINSQYKEAMLFSLLAFTSFKDIPNNVPSSTGAKRDTILGVISKP
jgi:anhydro-N-acetylmuramic acid kinase